MDSTTEPIIAVVGHPIAGNPSQFALERALRSLDLDWRVVSFDVHPQDVAAALQGFDVTGISGVLIDPSIETEASHWYARRPRATADNDQSNDGANARDDSDPKPPAAHDVTSKRSNHAERSGTPDQSDLNHDLDTSENTRPSGDEQSADSDSIRIDCLYRNQENEFLGSFQQRAWVQQQIEQHSGENRIWIGAPSAVAALGRAAWTDDPISLPPDPETIRAADLIVIARDQDNRLPLLECEDWPKDDGSTLIIDLTDGHPAQANIRQLGYRIVTDLDRRIGTLQRCLKQWTGEDCSAEVIHDAIEEYLAV